MDLKSFKRRIDLIKIINEEISRTNKLYEQLFSFNKETDSFILQNNWCHIETLVIENLIEDLTLFFKEDKETIKDKIEYFLYECNYGKEKREVLFETKKGKKEYYYTLEICWYDITNEIIEGNIKTNKK